MRYYMLDKITAFEAGKEVRGVKCVTLSDEVLHDHFPGFPILPGALIIEAMAQLAGFLLESEFNGKSSGGLPAEIRRAVLAQVEKMKFHGITGPGDRLELCARIDSVLEDAAQVSVEAQAGGEVKAKGRLTFAMLKIESARITQQRLEIYRIWTKDLPNCPPLR